MSGALNRRSTFAARVGVAGGLPPSWPRRSIGTAMPAPTAEAAPMKSRRPIFIDTYPFPDGRSLAQMYRVRASHLSGSDVEGTGASEHKLQSELQDSRIARAWIGARDPAERRRVVD